MRRDMSSSTAHIHTCRGGYVEVLHAPDSFVAELKKLMSINLCANTVGQVMVAAMMSPPQEGEESYAQYHEVLLCLVPSLCALAN